MTKIDTRTRIMDAAEELVLSHGFGGASLDTILERVGVSKGAFFHHFRSKCDLARALMDRFARADMELLESTVERAVLLSRDPVQRALLAVGLLEEVLRSLKEPHPGCLMASYCYQAELFDDEIHAVIRESFLTWRERLGTLFREAIESSPPRIPVDPEELADLATTVAEGAFILSRVMADGPLVARQIRHYRNYLELLFEPTQVTPPSSLSGRIGLHNGIGKMDR